jgi:RNA polymerase sigma factor (sigma-70 family)
VATLDRIFRSNHVYADTVGLMETPTDNEIIDRVLGGNTRSYVDLVERHQDKAMTLAMRMLRNREEAEEAVQDAFVKAFSALNKFEKRSRFSTWLYRIVFNTCSTALSKRKDEPSHPADHDDEEIVNGIPDGGETPDVILEGEEFRQHVLEAINELPPLYSGITTMFYLDNLSYEEIAVITRSPLGTVKAQLFRARTMLRKGIVRRTGVKELMP